MEGYRFSNGRQLFFSFGEGKLLLFFYFWTLCSLPYSINLYVYKALVEKQTGFAGYPNGQFAFL
jgi:hypothetical protein